MLKRIRMFFNVFKCFGVRLFLEVSRERVPCQTKLLVLRTSVLFQELQSVNCRLIEGPDEMQGQKLMSLNWTDKLDNVLCVQDTLKCTVCMLFYEI